MNVKREHIAKCIVLTCMTHQQGKVCISLGITELLNCPASCSAKQPSCFTTDMSAIP